MKKIVFAKDITLYKADCLEAVSYTHLDVYKRQHFNMVVGVPADTDLQKCTNHLENAFGRMGIHISKRCLLYTYRCV